jgi:hypothetical protein
VESFDTVQLCLHHCRWHLDVGLMLDAGCWMFTYYALRITFHVLRITLYVLRFTHYASRFAF